MHAADEHPIARFEAQVSVTLRRARADDLPKLEWFGWFTPHRQIIHETFERQQRGEVIMLLAIARDFPVGQAWIDLTRKAEESVGVIWALRVLPGLQGAGIGGRIITTAEQMLHARGFTYAELGVEHDNPGARRLYERSGYRECGDQQETVTFVRPDGRRGSFRVEEWLLRKDLTRRGTHGAALASQHARGTTERSERVGEVAKWQDV